MTLINTLRRLRWFIWDGVAAVIERCRRRADPTRLESLRGLGL
jgi:hypothetical protein